MRLHPLLQAAFLAPVLLTGCRDQNGLSGNPVGPAARPPVPPVSSPVQAPEFPPAPPGSVVYVEATPVYTWYGYVDMHGALVSRYVLYTGGSMGLQYSSANQGFFEYRGSYAVLGDKVLLTWNNDGGPPWFASAVLSGDVLSVKYNDYMQHSDFVDGDYVRVR